MLPTLLIALAGVVIGIFSAIAPLGPVTVLVVHRAMGRDFRGAMLIGLGRVPPECLYCGLATFGVVALLERFPGVSLAIEAFGTLLIFAVGVWLILARGPRAEPPAELEGEAARDPASPSATEARRQRWGDWSGFIISLLNPTLILTWSGAVAIAVSMMEYEPTLADKLVFPLTLGVGLVLGYLILIGLIRRWGEQLEAQLVRRVIQLMGLVFVILSVVNALSLLRAWR